jgi:hypothetical protein
MFPVSKKAPFTHSQRNTYNDDYVNTCNFCGNDDDYDPDESPLYKGFTWCSKCHQFSGECCTLTVNGCQYDTYFTKAIIGFEMDGIYTEGSPVITPEQLNKFEELLSSGKLKLKTWCPCPGFCPLYSVNDHRRTKNTKYPRGDHNDSGSGFSCCKSEKKMPKKELLEKYPTLQEQLKYARSTINPWPY